jgi:hypothetical protein
LLCASRVGLWLVSPFRCARGGELLMKPIWRLNVDSGMRWNGSWDWLLGASRCDHDGNAGCKQKKLYVGRH